MHPPSAAERQVIINTYIGFMEREVLGRQSPLFGRRTGQIFLKPFGYREAARFLLGASLLQRATTYFICGGIPLYLSYFRPTRSVLQNIEAALLREVAPLYQEPDFLLREELRDVEKYSMIVMSLATGSLPSRELARRSGIAEGSLHYYLDQLVSLGYIVKHFPLTAEAPKARDVRYRLLDPLLRFWFHFVFPYTSLIAQMRPRRAVAQIIQPRLDAYFSGCFEALCREALPLIYEREGVMTGFKIGSYWDRKTQIDVVGLREDAWTDLGECKWSTGASVNSVAATLEEKVQRYPNRRQATICRRLFLRARPGKGSLPRSFKVHTLEELYTV